jgi:Holliday junction resolvase RusA-like endonuclease
MTHRLNITPIPAPRLVRSDKWKKRPVAVKYFQYKETLQWMAKEARIAIGDVLEATFYMPMPDSWSKKKKEAMIDKPHQQTPDLDNLLKALQDSLLKSDSFIWKYRDCKKVWAHKGAIEIVVNEVNEKDDYLWACSNVQFGGERCFYVCKDCLKEIT